jgi:hypothetical protein
MGVINKKSTQGQRKESRRKATEARSESCFKKYLRNRMEKI